MFFIHPVLTCVMQELYLVQLFITAQNGKANYNLQIHMKIIRTNRRTLAIIVENDGSLTVRAPLHLHQQEIDRFLAAKKVWIQTKQLEAARLSLPIRKYESGEYFLFLGKLYPLDLVDGQDLPLSLNGSFRLDRRFQTQGREVFSRWYRDQARKIFDKRLAYFAQLHQLDYNRLRITSAKTRWGSCSSRKTISLAWRLVMAPPEVADYVILHELAHLEHANHSMHFWARLAQLCPDYKLHRKWLKENGSRLTL